MNLFEDKGFDLLQKNPTPGFGPVIMPEANSTHATFVEPPAGEPGDSDGDKKGSKTAVVILFLLIAVCVGAAIYMAERDAKKERLKFTALDNS